MANHFFSNSPFSSLLFWLTFIICQIPHTLAWVAISGLSISLVDLVFLALTPCCLNYSSFVLSPVKLEQVLTPLCSSSSEVSWFFLAPYSSILFNKFLQNPCWDFEWNNIKPIDPFGEKWHLYNVCVKLSYPWVWYISPFS